MEIFGPASHRPKKVRGLAEDAELSVSGDNGSNIYVLLGTEPSRNWRSFTAEIMDDRSAQRHHRHRDARRDARGRAAHPADFDLRHE